MLPNRVRSTSANALLMTMLITALIGVALVLPTHAQPAGTRPADVPSITRGRGTAVDTNLLPGCSGARVSAVGTIRATDGTMWTVPAENGFATAPKATDLYNDCSGVRLPNIGALDTGRVPIVTVDPEGDVVTGYLFADNYFELFVNGVLVAVDPVPFTPFNSCVVRFRVRRPYTIAAKLVDWEENLGLGSEANRDDQFHPGDGGFIASFSDGTVTDASWRAQTYYIAPLADSVSVVTKPDGTRSTAGLADPNCDGECYAAHYPIPEGWNLPAFDAGTWPAAATYTEAVVGVDNKPAYTNFVEQFGGSGARFIWSSNLVLDNLVLVRKTVGEVSGVAAVEPSRAGFEVVPNPIEGDAVLHLVMPSDGWVSIGLFDAVGRRVRTVMNAFLPAGEHSVAWSPRLESDGIPAGAYVLRMDSPCHVEHQLIYVRR